MKKLIVTADDFGWTKSTNDGIIRGVKEGIVTDIAVMVLSDPDDVDHGLKLLQSNNITEIGLHTCLFKWGKTDRPHRQDFINFFKNASDAEIEDVVLSEIEVYKKLLGLNPKFISPQFNMHGNLRLLKVLAKYAIDNKIPMRIPRAVLIGDEISDQNYASEIYLKRLGVKMTNHLFAHILGSYSTETMSNFINDLKTVVDGETTEILFHPGYNDIDVLEASSLNFERARDLSIVLDKKFKQQIIDLGFTFSHMSQL